MIFRLWLPVCSLILRTTADSSSSSSSSSSSTSSSGSSSSSSTFSVSVSHHSVSTGGGSSGSNDQASVQAPVAHSLENDRNGSGSETAGGRATVGSRVTAGAGLTSGKVGGSDEVRRPDEEISDDDDPATIEQEWKNFKFRRGVLLKAAGRKGKSESERKQRFVRNREQVREHNKQFDSGAVRYKTRINAFSDLDPDEFKSMMGLKRPSNLTKALRSSRIPQRHHKAPSRFRRQAPDSIDFRNRGYVTAVKEQGECGCCWSFAAVAALEGQLFAATGKLVDLSEQNLIDCAASTYGNKGCDGGWHMNAFDYVRDNGIMPLASYPFAGTDNQVCRFDTSAKCSLVSHGSALLPEADEEALKQAVYNIGPIAVAVNADDWGFQQYSSGVYFDATCSKDVDHAVAVVGYGEEDGQPYWLVKNSWGTDWGDDGYIKLARNNNNQCGIASFAAYPIIVGAVDDGWQVDDSSTATSHSLPTPKPSSTTAAAKPTTTTRPAADSDGGTEERSVAAFSGVIVGGVIELSLSQLTATGKVVLQGESEVLKLIDVSVDPFGFLTIQPKPNTNLRTSLPIKAFARSPTVDEIRAMGTSHIRMATPLNSKQLTISAMGASTIEISSGEVESLEVRADGASDISAFGLDAGNVRADATGASNIELTASKSLRASASGAANVVYRGSPQLGPILQTGAGSVKQDANN